MGVATREMLKGQGAYARSFSKLGYGRHSRAIGKRRGAGKDAEVASKGRRGFLNGVRYPAVWGFGD